MSRTQAPYRFLLDPADKAAFAPATRQQPANLKGLIRSGKILIGNVLSYPSTQVARTLAATGADWIWIDAEHVAWPVSVLVECVQIINHESAGRTVPIVRIPSKGAFEYMAYCLDAGAGGIILPHVDTAEEVAGALEASLFPPQGDRSFPPFSFIPTVTDHAPKGETVYSIANKHVSIIPQVESARGIAHMDAICAMEGVDAVMIGGELTVFGSKGQGPGKEFRLTFVAGDLRLELGLPLAFVGTEPTFVCAMETAAAAAKKHNKALVGAALGPEMVEERLRLGFRMLITTIDFHTMALGTMGDMAAARKTVEGSKYLVKEEL
ncbi:2,4-dihydroxyhept-2-ene-1,7-dioic acid aldolase [Mycena kentingensis (nom. inval.)]|nr:2,4-dihydroxyhept-2-ene-1,7-dioic acid aldolase [Mycena kentingensis (nom. inval.)]